MISAGQGIITGNHNIPGGTVGIMMYVNRRDLFKMSLVTCVGAALYGTAGLKIRDDKDDPGVHIGIAGLSGLNAAC